MINRKKHLSMFCSEIDQLASRLGRRLSVQTIGIADQDEDFAVLKAICQKASEYGCLGGFQVSHVYTYAHTYYMQTCMHAYACACMHAYIHMHTCIHIYMHIYTHKYRRLLSHQRHRVCPFLAWSISTYMHLFHTEIHTYIHTYIQAAALSVEALSVAISSVATMLTSCRTELTQVDGVRVNTVRSVTRESPRCVALYACVGIYGKVLCNNTVWLCIHV